MRPAGSFTLGLPQAGRLTEVLLAPAVELVSEADRQGVMRRLGSELAAPGPAEGRHRPVRIDGFVLRSVASGESRGIGASFSWSALRARRAVGLRAVAACVEGRHRFVAEAVRAVVDDLAATAGGPPERGAPGAAGGSLGCWLASLPTGGRAAVLSAATTWGEALFEALEWDRVAGRAEIGGPDRWGRCTALGGPPSQTVPVSGTGRPGAQGMVGAGRGAPGGVLVRARADVRVELAVGEGGAREPGTGGGPAKAVALLAVLGGLPGATSYQELAVGALGELLASPGGPVAARVVGLWPECGRAMVCEVDRTALDGAIEAVVGCARELRNGDGEDRSQTAERPKGRPAGHLEGQRFGRSAAA